MHDNKACANFPPESSYYSSICQVFIAFQSWLLPPSIYTACRILQSRQLAFTLYAVSYSIHNSSPPSLLLLHCLYSFVWYQIVLIHLVLSISFHLFQVVPFTASLHSHFCSYIGTFEFDFILSSDSSFVWFSYSQRWSATRMLLPGLSTRTVSDVISSQHKRNGGKGVRQQENSGSLSQLTYRPWSDSLFPSHAPNALTSLNKTQGLKSRHSTLSRRSDHCGDKEKQVQCICV